MSSTAHPRSRTLLLTTSVLTAVAFLPGCSSDDSSPESRDGGGSVSEVAAHAGELCPSVLPELQDQGDSGLGPLDPAATSVSLPQPESAAVCLYDATEGETSDGEATTYTWTITGPPAEVPEGGLASLGKRIADLSPAKADRTCDTDLGPRWLLVSTVGDDLTGVVIDEFGCNDVRLSDEPFENAPGEATQDGTAPGVFKGTSSLLTRLKDIWISA